MDRGIVALPGIIHHNQNGLHFERGLSPEEIRYYTLYWDKIVIPTNNLIHIGLQDEDILIESSVIERPKIIIPSLDLSNQGYIFSEIQAITAKKLTEEKSSTDWCLHQFGGTLNLPDKWMETKKTLRFDLMNILPVPMGDVHIVDILEFKERRKDEFKAIHDKIDAIYIEALKNPDSDLGHSKAIDELKEIVMNINNISKENKWKFLPFDFSIELQLDGKEIVKGATAGAIFDAYTGLLSMNLGSLIGASASCVNIKASKKLSCNISPNQSELAFLSNASKESIL